MAQIDKLEDKLMHYTGKAIADYRLIQPGDRVMVCLSGGKDSFTLLTVLNLLRRKAKGKFELHSFTLDQSQPGWNDTALREYLENQEIPYTILTKDTYSIVKEKTVGKTYC
ncbi:MAG: putative tRNA thiolase, partial [Pseudomonadota bacterium]